VLAVPPNLRQTYYPWLAFPPYHGDGFNFFNDRPEEIDEDVLVLSLGSGGMRRLQKQLPSARPGSFENTLTYDTGRNEACLRRLADEPVAEIVQCGEPSASGPFRAHR
jgi:hypothetical protein